MERDGVLTRNVKEGYVMKNDPFRKQMLVSPVVVPIEDGKLFDDQLDGIDLTTISYFQLRPGKHEESYKKKRVTLREGTEEDTDDEDDCNIRTELPSRKKPKLAKVLSGGPVEPFLTKPEGRVELVSVPIKNGVAVKGDIVKWWALSSRGGCSGFSSKTRDYSSKLKKKMTLSSNQRYFFLT